MLVPWDITLKTRNFLKNFDKLFLYYFQERCILDGTLTVNYDQVDVDYRLKHNDLLANIVHR